MNPIAALLPARNIVVDLDVTTKAQFFGAIGSVFERSAGLTPAGVAASLAAREKLGSTGLGQGIAIPHGRIPRLPEALDRKSTRLNSSHMSISYAVFCLKKKKKKNKKKRQTNRK